MVRRQISFGRTIFDIFCIPFIILRSKTKRKHMEGEQSPSILRSLRGPIDENRPMKPSFGKVSNFKCQCIINSKTGTYDFVQKKARQLLKLQQLNYMLSHQKKAMTFESWDEEECRPGKPVLPSGRAFWKGKQKRDSPSEMTRYISSYYNIFCP